MGTSGSFTSSRSRWLALGAAAVVAVGLTGAYGQITGAQPTTDPITLEVVSLDTEGAVQDVPDGVVPALSDTGDVVAYDTSTDDPGGSLPATRRVWIRDRSGDVSRPVAELGSLAPGISGDGCVVAYSVIGAGDTDVSLTLVDRCAAGADPDPLPLGTVLDTIAAGDVGAGAGKGAPTPQAAPPALSFDGSTVVWSTGREIRRYQRPSPADPFALTHTFDAAATASPDVVTGPVVDVSGDGSTIVFVAGPGATPFAPAPANVYAWSLSAPDDEPTLLSPTADGLPSASDSASPSISADGAFVVFESTGADLAAVTSPVVAPFVVGVDRTAGTGQVLVDDATRPALSADGRHVAYQRGDAIRMVSAGADATVDVELDVLAAARPSGAVAISQHGRWLAFTSAEDLLADAPAPAGPTGSAVWAADLQSSNPDVVDTTTTTTTMPPPAPSTTVPPTTPTSTAPPTTATASTLAPTPVVPTLPPVWSSYPPVRYPTAPRRTTTSGSSTSFVQPASGGASVSPISFPATVAGVGRRVQPVLLSNTSAATIGVEATSIAPVGAFSIVSDGCSGLRLAPSASCTIEVQFAPLDIGAVSALATFQLSDGSVVTAFVDGEGVPNPTLDLVPAVAGAGQTVTVFGVGFPAGSTVELSQPGAASAEPIAVDAAGTFAHVVVVLPNTPTGPIELTVAGQPDAFGDVTAELLISSRGATSGGAAWRSGPAGVTGR